MAPSREQAIAEARSFIGTPYHKRGMLKGIGVDCATFIYLVFFNLGLFPEQEVGVFSDDWFANTTEEKYLRQLLPLATKYAEGLYADVRGARPGDIALTRAVRSKVYNHGGIVTEWPMVIHAVKQGVQVCNALHHPMWTYQRTVILNPFGDD